MCELPLIMNFFKNLFLSAKSNSFNDSKILALDEWFLIRFNNDFISLEVTPPNRSAWTAQIEWKRINRICFKSGDLYNQDEVYIFTDERPESYLIPTGASGGDNLWNEIINRNLFDAEKAVEAATSTNELFCCPDT